MNGGIGNGIPYARTFINWLGKSRNKDDDFDERTHKKQKKKKPKKKRFDFFGRSRKKDEKGHHKPELEKIIEETIHNQKLLYIPRRAFNKINHLPEYDYLKFGLYVAKTKLILDDDVAHMAFQGKEDKRQWLLDRNMDSFLDMINWYEAKDLAMKLSSKLMTPAEYFCIRDFLQSTDAHEQMYGDMLIDMTTREHEWLDGILLNPRTIGNWRFREYELQTHTDIEDGEYVNGMVSKTEPMRGMGWFKDDEIEPYIGMPESLEGDEGSFFNAFRYKEMGLVRSSRRSNKDDKMYPAIMGLPPEHTGLSIGMRLCYTPTKLNKSVQKKISTKKMLIHMGALE